MERDSLQLQLQLHGNGMDESLPLSLYKSQYLRKRNPIMEPNYYCSSFCPSNSKGLLKAPPLSLYHSAPSISAQQQPPLLPLPASLPRRSSSCPTKIGTRNKHQKKSTKTSTSNNNYSTIPKKVGAETAPPPKNAARVDDSVIRERVDMLLSSVVLAISPPPPSSLPLPTFSLRPKLTCNAGIDAGATDDLRRLLRLH